MSLSLSRVVDVNISVSPLAQQRAAFGLLNVIGISDVIPWGERFRTYNTIDEVAQDFATTDEEYIAANVFFSQVPRPDEIMISRRANSAAPAELVGGANAETTIATWAAITDGAFDIDVDGVTENVVACDFSAVVDMDDVAAAIDFEFSGSCAWDATNTRFVLRTASTGATATISFASAPGAGTDISGLMACRSTDGGTVTDGIDAETISESLQAIQDKTDASATQAQDWYGFCFTAEVRDSDDVLEAADWAESRVKLFCNNTSDRNTLVTGNTTNYAYQLKEGGYARTFSTYDGDDDYPSVSAFGRHATVDYAGSNTTITLKFKQLPTVTPENLTSGQADNLIGVNCNYYTYFADSRMFAEGVVADGRFIDEVIGLDALQNALEVANFNVLYQSKTKVPQTNAGVARLVAACEDVCEQFVVNGFGAPGTVDIDDDTVYLEKGYQVTAQRVEDQSQADREARKAPPIEIIFKGAGAIHFVKINASFVR